MPHTLITIELLPSGLSQPLSRSLFRQGHGNPDPPTRPTHLPSLSSSGDDDDDDTEEAVEAVADEVERAEVEVGAE